MTALVLAVVALILALTALVGFIWLLIDGAWDDEPVPPEWVNDHSRGTNR